MSTLSRSAAALAVALLLGACSEGYPDESEVVMLHYGMERVEAVTAMNRIAEASSRRNPTRFAWLDDCVLEMHVRRPADGRESRTLPLEGSRADTAPGPGGEGYRVTLHRIGSDELGVTVMHDLPWAEAKQMKWLLDYLQGSC